MSSVIPDMDATIAKALQETGWPGADQVADLIPEDEQGEQHEEEQAETAGENEEVEASGAENDSAETGEETQENEAEESEEEEKPSETEQKYQPKWKKAALKVLEGLPEEQQELLRQEDKRREEAFHKGIEQYREGNNRAKEYDEAVRPYMSTIQSVGATPTQAIQALLAADHNLRYSQPAQKVGFMLKIMQDYGVNPQDIVSAVGAIGQNQTQVDPVVQQLQQQVHQMQASQQQAQHQAQVSMQAKIDAEIAAFAADPDNEHFELLRPYMKTLADAQPEANLRDLYDQAMKIHPKTAAIWEAQQQQKWTEQRKAKLQSVKKPTNVRSNGRAAVTNPTKPATMDQTIEAEAKRLGLM